MAGTDRKTTGRLLLSGLLLVVLNGCAATVEKQERCTPQFPPAPCDESSSAPPKVPFSRP